MRSGYNQRKASLLAAVRAAEPGYATAREVLAWLHRQHPPSTARPYGKELRVIATRLLTLSQVRDPTRTTGYSKPYLTSRLVRDDETGRRARAYRLSAKGRRVLERMEAGELRGLLPREPLTPVIHEGRTEGGRWACGRKVCRACSRACAAREHAGTTELELEVNGELIWDCGRSECTECHLTHALRALSQAGHTGGTMDLVNDADEPVWDCGEESCSSCARVHANLTHPGTRDLGLTEDGTILWDCGRAECDRCLRQSLAGGK